MTENEAIEIIKNFPKWNLDDQWLDENEMKDLSEMVIAALEEIRQYRALGTVTECREAMEKQKKKISDIWGDGYSEGKMIYDTYECPNCGKNYEIDCQKYDYCPACGQAIDLSDLEKSGGDSDE